MVRVKYRYLAIKIKNELLNFVNSNLNESNFDGKDHFQKYFSKWLHEELRKKFGLIFMSKFFIRFISTLEKNHIFIIQLKRDQAEVHDFIKEMVENNKIELLSFSGSVRSAKLKFLKIKDLKSVNI